jgi:hypothetical protein
MSLALGCRTCRVESAPALRHDTIAPGKGGAPALSSGRFHLVPYHLFIYGKETADERRSDLYIPYMVSSTFPSSPVLRSLTIFLLDLRSRRRLCAPALLALRILRRVRHGAYCSSIRLLSVRSGWDAASLFRLLTREKSKGESTQRRARGRGAGPGPNCIGGDGRGVDARQSGKGMCGQDRLSPGSSPSPIASVEMGAGTMCGSLERGGHGGVCTQGGVKPRGERRRRHRHGRAPRIRAQWRRGGGERRARLLRQWRGRM